MHFVDTATPSLAVHRLLGSGGGDANRLVLAFKERQLALGLSPATVNRRLSALRSLVRLARLVGAITWSIEVPAVASVPYRDTRGPGKDGLELIVAAAAKQADPKRSRDLAILWMLYGRGFRRAEVARVHLEDLDLPHALTLKNPSP